MTFVPADFEGRYAPQNFFFSFIRFYDKLSNGYVRLYAEIRKGVIL